MKKELYFLVVFTALFSFFIVQKSGAQTPVKLWDAGFGGTVGDGLTTLVAAPGGGYLLGGASQSGISGNKTVPSRGGYDYWVVKVDAGGNRQWDRTFGGTGNDTATALIATPDGGYLLGGYSLSGMSGDKTEASKGMADYWVVKLDAAGNKQWDKTFGGDGNDQLFALAAAPGGGYLLGGFSLSGTTGDKTAPSKGLADYWVVKIDAGGNKQWDKTFGGTSLDYFASLIATADGGYLLGGSSLSGVSGDKTAASRGLTDYWVVKIDTDGNKQWDRAFGGANQDNLAALALAPDGGYLLGGASLSGISGDKSGASKGGRDYWVVKLDGAGNKQWDKTVGGANQDYLTALTAVSGGGFLLGGSSWSGISGDKTEASKGLADYWLVRLDAGGNSQWDKTYGGDADDQFAAIGATSGEDFLLGGTSLSGVSGDKAVAAYGGNDYWAVRISAAVAGTISTGALAADSLCAGSPVSIPFTATGTFNSGNIFSAQLSSASGSFMAPETIGTLSGTASGTINATIPSGTQAGNGYRIRVVSGNPVVTGTDNGRNLTINPSVTPSVSIAASATAICEGTPVTFTATAAHAGTAPVYQWRKNGNNVGGNSPTYTDNALSYGDVVGVTLTSNAVCATTATAASNSITITTLSGVPAKPGVITGATPVCPGDTQSYAITPVANAASYAWTVPAGAAIVSGQGTTAVEVRFSSSYTTGNITVAAVNCAGSSIIRGYTVALQPRPATPAAITGSSPVCPGDTLSYSIAPVPNATTYAWTVPAGAAIISGQGTTSVAVRFSSSYASGYIKVKAANCGSSSAARSFAAVRVPRPGTPGWITGTNSPVCGQANTYSIPAVRGAVSYTWSVPAGASIASGQGTPDISLVLTAGFQGGLLTVYASNCSGNSGARGLRLYATAAAGCKAGAAVTGISEQMTTVPALAVKAALNPFVNFGTLHIQGRGMEPVRINVVNSIGEVMEQRRVAASISSIQLGHHYPPGTYLVEVMQGDSRQTVKLVKQ